MRPSVDEPFYDAEDEAPPAPKKAKMEVIGLSTTDIRNHAGRKQLLIAVTTPGFQISSQVESVPKPSVPTDASDLNENIRSGSSSSLVGEDNESPQSSQYTDDTEESRQQQVFSFTCVRNASVVLCSEQQHRQRRRLAQLGPF